jgi:hypothetical protein
VCSRRRKQADAMHTSEPHCIPFPGGCHPPEHNENCPSALYRKAAGESVQWLRQNTLDGKRIAYHSGTVFLVQIGRGSKGKYATHYSFTGNLQQAVLYYNAINIGKGYKKRLLAPGFNKPVLARQTS